MKSYPIVELFVIGRLIPILSSLKVSTEQQEIIGVNHERVYRWAA